MRHKSSGRENDADNCTSSQWSDASEKSDSQSLVVQDSSKAALCFLNSSEVDELFSSIAAALTCVLCEKLVGLEERDSSVAVVQSCGHFFCSSCINTCIEKGFKEKTAMARARTALRLVKEDEENDSHGTVNAEVRFFHPTVPTIGGKKKEMSPITHERKKRQPKRCFQCPICFGPAMKWTLTTPVPFISHLSCTLKKEMPSLVACLEKGVHGLSKGCKCSRNETTNEVPLSCENDGVEKCSFALENGESTSVVTPLFSDSMASPTVASLVGSCSFAANTVVNGTLVQCPNSVSCAPHPFHAPSSVSSPSLPSSFVSPLPIASHTVQQASLFYGTPKEASPALPHPSGVECSVDLFGFVPETSDPLLCSPPPLSWSLPMLAPLIASTDSMTPLHPPPSSPSSLFPTSPKEDPTTRREGKVRSNSISLVTSPEHHRKRPRSTSSVMSFYLTSPLESSSPFCRNPWRKQNERDEFVEWRQKEVFVPSSNGAVEQEICILLDPSFEDPLLLPTLKRCLEGVLKRTDTNGMKKTKENAAPPLTALILVDERGVDSSASAAPPLGHVSSPGRGTRRRQEVSHLTRVWEEAAADETCGCSPRFLLKETIWPLEYTRRQYLVFGKWEQIHIRTEEWFSLRHSPRDDGVSDRAVNALEESHTWCGCVSALTPMICTTLLSSATQKGVKEEVEWYRCCWRIATRVRSFMDSFSLFLFPLFPLQREGGAVGEVEEHKKEETIDAGEEEWWKMRVPVAWKRNGKVHGIHPDSCNAFAALLRHHLASFTSSPFCVTPLNDVVPAVPSSPLRIVPPLPPSLGAWIQEGRYVFFLLPDAWCHEAIAFWCWWQQEEKIQETKESGVDEGRMKGKSVLVVEERAGTGSPRDADPSLDGRSIGGSWEDYPPLAAKKGESSAEKKKSKRSRCAQFFKEWRDDRKVEEEANNPSSNADATRRAMEEEWSGDPSCRTAGFTHESWHRLVQTASGAVVEVSRTLWVTLLVYLVSDPSRFTTLMEQAWESCAVAGEGSEEEVKRDGFARATRTLVQELSALQEEVDLLHVPASPPAAFQKRDHPRDPEREVRRADPHGCGENEIRFGFPLGIHLHHFARENRKENHCASLPSLSMEQTMEDAKESSVREGPHLLLLHQTLSEHFLVECKSMAEESMRRWTTSSVRGSRQEMEELTQDGQEGSRRSWTSFAGDTMHTVVESKSKAEKYEKECGVSLSVPPTPTLRQLSSHLLTAAAQSLYLLLFLFQTSIFSSPYHTVVENERKGMPSACSASALSTRADARTAAWFLTNLAEGRQEAGVKRSAASSFENTNAYRFPFRCTPSRRRGRGALREGHCLGASAGEKTSPTPILLSPSLECETGTVTVQQERIVVTPEKKILFSSSMVSPEKGSVHKLSLSSSSNTSEMDSARDDLPSALLHPIFRDLLYEDSP